MQKDKKIPLILLLSMIATFLVAGVIVICLKLYKESLYLLFPIPFTIGIFFSFKATEETLGKNSRFIFSIVLRFVCILIALVVPAVIYKYVESFYNSISAYWIFAPFVEILVAYFISTFSSMYVARLSEKEKEQ